MKKFKVSLLLCHESFSGRDHCDGWQDFLVEAKEEKLAIEKAKKLKPFGCWVRNAVVKKIEETP